MLRPPPQPERPLKLQRFTAELAYDAGAELAEKRREAERMVAMAVIFKPAWFAMARRLSVHDWMFWQDDYCAIYRMAELHAGKVAKHAALCRYFKAQGWLQSRGPAVQGGGLHWTSGNLWDFMGQGLQFHQLFHPSVEDCCSWLKSLWRDMRDIEQHYRAAAQLLGVEAAQVPTVRMPKPVRVSA